MGTIKIENLIVRTGEFTLKIPHLEASSGEILCVIGRSGSGKSTLLNAIAGFQKLESGRILVDGKDISLLPPEQRRVAIVFQRPALFPKLTVFENIEFGLRVQKIPKEERQVKVRNWLRKLDIETLEKRYGYQISGGEAQRVTLARSLIVGFPILLMDEPFSALDSSLRENSRREVKDLIKELGIAAMLVSHDPEDVKALGTRVFVLADGKITQSGAP